MIDAAQSIAKPAGDDFVIVPSTGTVEGIGVRFEMRLGARTSGLADRGPPPYLGTMRFLARLSPLRAIQDLRIFLSQRQPYEIWFMMLSIVVTGGILIAFIKDSAVAPVYRPDIIYVRQWTADRTDAQIRAQQKIDQVQIDKDKAELKRRQAELQAGYRRLDDKLKRYGL